MAMDIGGSKGGPKSDINVTPLVDVMLVLLIIMMLIAPMLQKGVNVKLPEADNTVAKPDTEAQTVIAIDSANQFWLNGIQVAKSDFVEKVKDRLEDKTEKVVLIRADQDALYSAVMEAMDDLRKANIEDVGLITEKKETKAGVGGQ